MSVSQWFLLSCKALACTEKRRCILEIKLLSNIILPWIIPTGIEEPFEKHNWIQLKYDKFWSLSYPHFQHCMLIKKLIKPWLFTFRSFCLIICCTMPSYFPLLLIVGNNLNITASSQKGGWTCMSPNLITNIRSISSNQYYISFPRDMPLRIMARTSRLQITEWNECLYLTQNHRNVYLKYNSQKQL